MNEDADPANGGRACTQALACGPEGWAKRVTKLQAEKRDLSKRCKALQEETTCAAGLALAATARTLGGVIPHFHRRGGTPPRCSSHLAELLARQS